MKLVWRRLAHSFCGNVFCLYTPILRQSFPFSHPKRRCMGDLKNSPCPNKKNNTFLFPDLGCAADKKEIILPAISVAGIHMVVTAEKEIYICTLDSCPAFCFHIHETWSICMSCGMTRILYKRCVFPPFSSFPPPPPFESNRVGFDTASASSSSSALNEP